MKVTDREKASDEWLSMANSISDVEGSILDCKKSIEEFDNELLQLHWDIFDRIQGQFKDLDSELSNLRGLFADSKVTDDNFNWSKEGIAQLGLLAQQYELAQHQIQKYNDAIAELKSAYNSGKYSATEYMDKLSELSSAQWDAVNSSESIKDAIVDLNEVRIDEEISAIEEQIDAYKELIDTQIKALKAEKDLHDYQERIAEKAKTVTELERQIAAMQNDNTAATIAKRKQLEEQLVQAKKDLESEQYEHSIEEQENALNKEYENYEAERNKEIEALKASLEEREALIAASFETVKQNANLVGQEIATIATEHGITVSNAIITSWQNGETAIASYGEVLSAGTSAFIENLTGVEYEVYNLQAQADATASTLAWMFATRADNLVGELAASYYSEQNLNAMTQALHDSLINTLEGGYNISGITSALDGIASGLNGVASAARDAANAMAAVGAAQVSANTPSYSNTGNSGVKTNSTSTSRPLGGGRGVIGGSSGGKVTSAAVASNSFNKYLKKYAKGGIVTKEKDNPLNHIAEAVGEDTIIAAKEGEGVLTKEQVELLEKFAESAGGGGKDENGRIIYSQGNNENPVFGNAGQDEYIARLMKEHPAEWIQQYMLGAVTNAPEIIPNNINKNNNVNVHYDSLVTVNGDVNDTKHFLHDMKSVAKDAIKESWHDFEMTRKYGIY